MRQKKLLFVLKDRGSYGGKPGSYGLINSCTFVIEELRKHGIDAELVQVVDNNDIDREVTKRRPTHVFIEALWVIPAKFEVLSRLHPGVEWIIHLHSKIPFLATEGMSIQWIGEYLALRKKGIKISVAANNQDCMEQLNVPFDGVFTLPNMYFPPKLSSVEVFPHQRFIDIGCFGALRVLKNTLEQAILAMKFAEKNGKILRFHINHSEHEPEITDPVYKNLVYLFQPTQHLLYNHGWLPHEEFLKLVLTMDLGMQVSYTESFNIVAADFIHCNIPIVVSDEINWVYPLYRANVAEPDDILSKMKYAYAGKHINAQYVNKIWLAMYNKNALKKWLEFLKPGARYYNNPLL